MAERYRDELKKEIPEIDAVLGTGEVDQILGAHRDSGPGLGTGQRHGAVPLTFHSKLVGASSQPRAPSPEPRAPSLPDLSLRRRNAAAADDAEALRVREGCRGLRLHLRVLHHPDAARQVPQPRRGSRSCARRDRSPTRGVKELLLISQDTTFYGIDRGERGALARLLRELNEVDGLEWIRLLYLYPTTITDDVLAAMAECEKVCRYIDLPLQHASAGVLKRMRRPGDRRTYDKLLDRIRRHGAGRHAADDLHRRLSGRDRRGVRRARAVRRGHRLRPRRRLHVLARGRHAGVRDGRRRPGGGQAQAAQRPDGAAEEDRRARRRRPKIGREVAVLIDGPSPEHELVLQGRLEGRRRTSIRWCS